MKVLIKIIFILFFGNSLHAVPGQGTGVLALARFFKTAASARSEFARQITNQGNAVDVWKFSYNPCLSAAQNRTLQYFCFKQQYQILVKQHAKNPDCRVLAQKIRAASRTLIQCENQLYKGMSPFKPEVPLHNLSLITKT